MKCLSFLDCKSFTIFRNGPTRKIIGKYCFRANITGKCYCNLSQWFLTYGKGFAYNYTLRVHTPQGIPGKPGNLREEILI